MTRKTGDGVTALTPATQADDRKAKRTRPRRDKRKPFELAYPDCAGIDVGSKSHFVSVPPDRDVSRCVSSRASRTISIAWRIGWPRAGSGRW